MSVIDGPDEGASRSASGPRGRRGEGDARRRAREVALQVLYAIDLTYYRSRPPKPELEGDPETAREEGRGADEGPPPPVPLEEIEDRMPEEIFDIVAAHFPIPEKARSFARELVARVREHADVLDATITEHSRNWRVARMAAVDRNILRLGVYELRFTETPAPVILNESVDLARRFSGDPSPAFVNGILDAVARATRDPDA